MKGLKNSLFRFSPASACFLLLFLHACSDPEHPGPDQQDFAPTPYGLDYPQHFPILQLPKDNPPTVEGVKLGRMLYYDKKLSANGPKQGLSCASCHEQSLAFTAEATGMQVLPHINLGWNSAFLWEGKVYGSLEDIMEFEVRDFFQTDLSMLRDDPAYPQLYKEAFGDEEITLGRTTQALAQFFRRLISANSKYDRYLNGEEALNTSELKGMDLFFSEKGDCFHCHTSPLMTDNRFHNIGLDAAFSGIDRGRFNFTGDPGDMGKFKSPTLRNIELTAPYMHDGRFETLEEVIEFYNSGIAWSETLDPLMTKPGKNIRLGLTEEEKAQLLAFLKTLTDDSFLNNPELSNPF